MTPLTGTHHTLSPDDGAIDSRKLQVFLAAAQTSSFVAAAEQLHLVPSAVSHAIRTLEEEFECSLFRRHGPRVTLTRAGIRLMPLAEELLGRMAQVRRELAVIRGSGRHLRVMMPEAFCCGMLPKVLPDFMECFPSALFEVKTAGGEPQKCVAALLSGQADLLVLQKQDLGGEIVRRDLFVEEWGFYVASFHPLARVGEPELSTLGQWTFLAPNGEAERMTAERLAKIAPFEPRIWSLPSLGSVMDLARAGQGVAVLPLGSVEKVRTEGNLVPLMWGGPPMPWTWSCYWSGGMDPSWAAEVFMSLVSMVAQESVLQDPDRLAVSSDEE